MKLKRMELVDFRQYYGKQNIEFAYNDKNVTIIYGTNGKGKTGLFRALMFALYGTTRLGQDNNDANMHLVNFKRLEENGGGLTEAKVKVEFEHNDCQYTMERTIKARRDGKNIEERVGDPYFYFVDKDGQILSSPEVNTAEVDRRMNEILHEGIKDFFFFDAEKIEELAKRNSKKSDIIENGILKLLQIEHLKKAKDLVNDLYKKESKKAAKKINSVSMDVLTEQIDKAENDIKVKTEELHEIETEYDAMNKEFEENQVKIDENGKCDELVKEKDAKIKAIKDCETNIEEKKKNMQKNIVDRYSKIIGNEFIGEAKEIVSQINLDNNEILTPIIINTSLNNNKCICCSRDLDEYTRMILEEMKKKISHNSNQADIIKIISDNYILEDDIDEYKEELKNDLKSYQQAKNNLEKLKKERQDIEEKINEMADSIDNLKGIVERQKEIKKDKEKNVARKLNLEKEISELKITIENKTKEREEEMKKNSDIVFDKKVIDKLKEYDQKLTTILKRYCANMRERLSNETNMILDDILDVKNLISEIEITEKYEIRLKNSNADITDDISQGQQQMVALAYITALAKLASKNEDKIDFPLFMDTPFARISGDNRDNLITNIPKLTSQWVLLLTDTEYTKSEEDKFKEVGRVGKYYILNQKDTDYTEIEEISEDVSIAERG